MTGSKNGFEALVKKNVSPICNTTMRDGSLCMLTQKLYVEHGVHLQLTLSLKRKIKDDSLAKGFKKISSFTFIACTYLLIDMIPTDNLDLAMIRPSAERVIQQLSWLKINGCTQFTGLMSVASHEKLTEFKRVRVTDTPVFRRQLKKVRTNILN